MDNFGFKPASTELKITEKIAMPDEKLDTRAANILQKCESFSITNRDDFALADKIVSDGAALIRGIKLLHDPLCAATNTAHKLATSTRKSLIDPVDQGTRLLSTKMANFKLAEDNRIAEERRLEQEKAQKLQEEAVAEQVKAMEKEKVDPVVIESVKELATQPVIVESVKEDELRSKTSFTIGWEIKVENKELVPETFKVVDEAAVMKVVNASKGGIQIPGINITQVNKARRNAAR